MRPFLLGQRRGPLEERGAILEVSVAQPALVAERLRAEGRPVPEPSVIRALVDTGATISGLDNRVAGRLGLVQTGSVTLAGIGGTTEQPVYSAAVGFPALAAPGLDPARLAGTSLGSADFEMLLGRDILRHLVMTYDGPREMFTLTHAGGAPAVFSPSGGGVDVGGLVLVAAAVGGVLWATGALGR